MPNNKNKRWLASFPCSVSRLEDHTNALYEIGSTKLFIISAIASADTLALFKEVSYVIYYNSTTASTYCATTTSFCIHDSHSAHIPSIAGT